MAIEIHGVAKNQAQTHPNGRQEEKPSTARIQDFLFELVNVLKDKLNAQNSKIDRVRTDVSLIKQNDIENLKNSIRGLNERLDRMEKKCDQQEIGIDTRILDTLKRA